MRRSTQILANRIMKRGNNPRTRFAKEAVVTRLGFKVKLILAQRVSGFSDLCGLLIVYSVKTRDKNTREARDSNFLSQGYGMYRTSTRTVRTAHTSNFCTTGTFQPEPGLLDRRKCTRVQKKIIDSQNNPT